MTSWTRNADIKKRLGKKWNNGFFLAQCVNPEGFEPLRIPLKHPTAGELVHQFDAARAWVEQVIHNAGKEEKNYTIEWKEINHRSLGRNKMPRAVIFETLDQILSWLGRTTEAGQYKKLYKKITARYPELADLLSEKPLDVLAHDLVWNELLSIVSYLEENIRPAVYLRQLEIPGVDTKFIENHKAWLTKLLTGVLPPDAVNEGVKGPAAFERRFGFRSKPARIRFRTLDPDLDITGLSDLEIPVDDFCRLPITPETVFIVENEITGLAFPRFPKAIVVLGLGYGLSSLSNAFWMKNIPIWYWGDMDTHGFAMLDQIRHHFPQTRSFLMDEVTLLAHESLWVQEPSPVKRDLPLLTAQEAKVYDSLRYNVHAPNLRLEQERVSFSQVKRVVASIQRGNSLTGG